MVLALENRNSAVISALRLCSERCQVSIQVWMDLFYLSDDLWQSL